MVESSPKKLSILRRPQVEIRTGMARSTIYLGIKAGTFPQPIKLGPRSVGWLENEVEDWLRLRVKARDRELEAGR